MWHCSELTPSSRKEGSHLLRGHRPRPFSKGTAAVSVAPQGTALCRSLCAALGWRVWPPCSNQANLEGSPSLTASRGCGLHPACRASHPTCCPNLCPSPPFPSPPRRSPKGHPWWTSSSPPSLTKPCFPGDTICHSWHQEWWQRANPEIGAEPESPTAFWHHRTVGLVSLRSEG